MKRKNPLGHAVHLGLCYGPFLRRHSWPRGFLSSFAAHKQPQNRPGHAVQCYKARRCHSDGRGGRYRLLSARGIPSQNVEVGRTLSGKTIGPNIYERSIRGSKHTASDFSSRKRSGLMRMPAVVSYHYSIIHYLRPRESIVVPEGRRFLSV